MGLQYGDLEDLVYNIFEIDSYKSKMGSDKDIVVLSFNVKTEDVGKDLVNFIEKGYDFILDADVTPGEQSSGYYKVFVEMERNQSVPKNIGEIINDLKNLTNSKNYKFRYYKSFKSYDVNEENLNEYIPIDTASYEQTVNENNLNNYKNFFNKSFVDSIDMLENILTIKKIYADPIQFKFIDFDNANVILNNLNESLNFNDFGETIFLVKYIGDYNITKYGNKFVLENDNQALVLERVQV